MPDRKEIVAKAKSVQEAIVIALKELRAKKDEVEIKILSEGTKGLFNMGGEKQAKVRATQKEKR